MDKQKNIENIYPLSPMQQGILFHSLLAPDAGAYVPQVCITVDGLTDVVAFQKSWEEVFRRHSILRTAFRWEKRDRPFQVVYKVLDLPWQQQDWREFSISEQQQKLEDFLKEDRQQGFDLKIAPLFRINIIQLTETRYQIVWTQHHLIIDGWSAGLVIKEVFQLYQVFYKGVDLPIYNIRPYADYIAWLGQQDLSAAKKFWETKLQGFSTPNILQVKQSSSNSTKPNWNQKEISLSANITNNLKTLAKNHQFTLNTLIQGAFAILLSRYCNQDDIVFGATSSGRPATLTGSESMVGLFINTLPVRVQVDPQASLINWLQQLQTQQVEALQYEYSPLLEIQSWSEIPRGSTLFEHILVFENYPVDASLLQSQAGLKIEKVNSLEWTSFPLTMLVSAANELNFKIKYDSNRFDNYTIENLLIHFHILLESIANNSGYSLIELPLLTNAEQQLFTEWNSTQTEYPKQCIHELFEAQVERNKNATAVIFEDEKLTYQELNIKANQVAHYLRSIGVKPEVLVGICLERSVEMVIAILAILKAGGAYVPLDPDYPTERLNFIQEETQLKTVLTQEKIQEILSNAAQFSQSNPVNNTTLENSIYVIYTSGSTGKPKGVINTHRGLVNRLCWMQQTYQLTTDDRVLQKTPFSFDVSVWEFFWTLLFGATLIVAKPEAHKDSGYLVNLIAEQQITTLHFVPSMLEAFLEEPKLKESCTSLKRVICSGEALTVELQKRFFNHLDAQLYNLYGPTEAAIDVTFYEGKRQEAKGKRDNNILPHSSYVPIGTPIHNTQIHILDSHLRQLPIGVAGELYIGGDGLARGYLNRFDLTAERFIPNPFNQTSPPSPLLSKERGARTSPLLDKERGVRQDGVRLYKTGDLACYLPDGSIKLFGRIDNQVKIRGFRIEIGEIEALLNQYPGIQASLVIVREDNPGDKRLVAYIVPESEINIPKSSELRRVLKEKLADYMIPGAFVVLDSLPLTPNGKVDTKSLPVPDWSSNSSSEFVAARTPTEEKLVKIFTDVLEVESVGIEDDFFTLGGHSLLATKLIAQLLKTFDVEITVIDLFEAPTVAELAQRVDKNLLTQQLQGSVDDEGEREEIEF